MSEYPVISVNSIAILIQKHVTGYQSSKLTYALAWHLHLHYKFHYCILQQGKGRLVQEQHTFLLVQQAKGALPLPLATLAGMLHVARPGGGGVRLVTLSHKLLFSTLTVLDIHLGINRCSLYFSSASWYKATISCPNISYSLHPCPDRLSL